MNAAHLHLMLNHFPVFGTLFALAALLYGNIKQNKTVIQLAFVGFIVTAVVAIPVFISGGHAEEIVEHMQGVTKAAIEEHEEIAEAAFWFMEGLGVLSLATLLLVNKKEKLARALTNLTLLLGLVTFATMGWAANKGGQIRHSEISQNVQVKETGE